MPFDNGWGYGDDEAQPAAASVASDYNPSAGVQSVDSMSAVSTADPTIQELVARSGASPERIEQILAVIQNAIRHGIPPEQMQMAGDVGHGIVMELYDRAAAEHGTSADAIRAAQEAQSEQAMDMLREGMGALVGGAAAAVAANPFFAALSPNDRQKFSGLAQDTQMTIAEEGMRLTEKGTQHAAGEQMNFVEQQDRGHGVNTGAGINRGDDMGRFA